MKAKSRSEAIRLNLSHYFTGKPCIRGHISKRRASRGDCVECIKELDARRYAKNPDKFKNKQLKIYYSSRDKYIKAASEYYEKNRDKVNRRRSNWVKEKRASDPLFSLRRSIRSRMWSAFKNGWTKRAEKTEEIVGCDWCSLKEHIEKQFSKGMSWQNRDKWHIDHIVPLASARTEDELIALSHFTNLRPIWAKDNLSKGAKEEFLI